MKKKAAIVILLVLAAGMFLYTGWLQEKKPDEVFTESHAETPITLKPGDIITVELDENPSTGYSWQCRIEDENIIVMESHHFKPPVFDRDIVGAPGKHIFNFLVKNRGSTSITFDYCRTWEEESVKTHVFYFETK